jgi:hypothetical protein
MLPFERRGISRTDLILELSIKTSRPEISLFVQLYRLQILHTTPIIFYQIVTVFHPYNTQTDLFHCSRFNPRLISSSFQPIFRNRIAALEEAAFSPLSGAGNMFLYDSQFYLHDGRSELNEVASFNAEILHLEMPLTCYIFNN